MEIKFSDEKIRQIVSTKVFQKEHGPKAYKALQNLLLKLKAADTMQVFWPPYSKKERCHELENKKHRDMRNHLCLTILEGLRLIVLPEQEWINSDPSTRTWAEISSVTIVYAGDYHDD